MNPAFAFVRADLHDCANGLSVVLSRTDERHVLIESVEQLEQIIVHTFKVIYQGRHHNPPSDGLTGAVAHAAALCTLKVEMQAAID